MRTLLFVLIGFITYTHIAVSAQAADPLRVGWYNVDPFQHQTETLSEKVLTGLDIELLKVISQRAGYEVQFEKKSWRQQLADIKSGKQDIAIGATVTESRQAFAHFSIPYREETIVLYMQNGLKPKLKAKDAQTVFAKIQELGLRVAVIDAFHYPDKVVNDFVTTSSLVTKVEDDKESIQLLLDDKVDVFLGDQTVVSTLLWRMGLHNVMDKHPLTYINDVHIMFSKATVPESVVIAFNDAIRDIKSSGTFNRINTQYLFPIFLSQTIDTDWFFVIDLLGTVVFILSGLLLAFQHRYDIFGAFVLAALPAVGGGIIRDLLTQRDVIAFLDNPLYIIVIVAMVIAGFISLKLYQLLSSNVQGALTSNYAVRQTVAYIIKIFDALGLAAFTVTGVVVALSTQSEPLWIWGPVMATITGAGGGILRDVVRSDPNIPTLKGQIYPEIALIWGGFLSGFLIWQSAHINPPMILIGIVTTMVGVFITRMLVVHYQLKSPLFVLK